MTLPHQHQGDNPMTPPQKHCAIEKTCRNYGETIDAPDPCKRSPCEFDTRSHPATTPDETISSLISENARIGAELKRILAEVARLNGEHDATIAAQAREELLDEIAKRIEIAEEDEHDDDYWRGISRVSDIIQSLRSTKEQPSEANKR